MTVTAVQLQRPAAPASTPVWMVLSIGAAGVAMALATWVGGQWPLTVLVMMLLAGALALVVSRPHIGILLFLTTFLINYPAVTKGVGYFTINNVLGAFFLSLLAWDYYLKRDAWYLREPLVWMLLAIGAVMVASTIGAEYTSPDSYIQAVIHRSIGDPRARMDYTHRWLFQHFSRVAFVIFVLNFIRTPRQLRMVFLTLLACILAAIPLVLLAYSQTTGEEFRMVSRTVNWADNVNRFAFGCILGVSFLYQLFSSARSMWAKATAMLGAVLLLPLVLFAASRSGFLGLFLLGALVLFGQFGFREGGGSHASALAAVLMLIGLVLLTFMFALGQKARERVLNINPFAAERLEGSRSTEQRSAAVEDSLALIRMHPLLGVGVGNFRWVNKYYHDSFKPPHNSYLWAAAEGGLVLLAAYLMLFRLLWRRLSRLRVSYARRSDLPYFPHWLRVYMILLMFFSFFADVWLEEHIFLLVASAVLLDRWRDLPPDGQAPAPSASPERARDRGYARLAPESALAGEV